LIPIRFELKKESVDAPADKEYYTFLSLSNQSIHNLFEAVYGIHGIFLYSKEKITLPKPT
jgi:hypothetical protein